MRSAFIAWTGRVVGLVLATMVTLSIIDAISAIPPRSVGGGPPWDRVLPSTTRDAPSPHAPSPDAQAPEQRETIAPDGPLPVPEGTIAVTARPPSHSDGEAWLEVIAHALIALASLAALGLLLLWRAVAEWRRLADILESRVE